VGLRKVARIEEKRKEKKRKEKKRKEKRRFVCKSNQEV